MPWIRSDCCILDDKFVVEMTGDEYKAWSFFLHRVKAQGARGGVSVTDLSILARNWNVPEAAIVSMFKKAGNRIWTDGGRWYVKNWSKYQEDHKSKTAKGEFSPNTPDAPDGTTLHNTTQHHTTGQDAIASEQLETVVCKWNEIAKACGLSVVERLTDKRKAAVRKRLSEPGFDLDKILGEIQHSSFLRGSTNWRVTFDWVFLSANNYVKVLEGQYKDGSSRSTGKRNYNFDPSKYPTLSGGKTDPRSV
jgi:hypothetical protein